MSVQKELSEVAFKIEAAKRRIDGCLLLYESAVMANAAGSITIAGQDVHDAVDEWMRLQRDRMSMLRRSLGGM